ALPATSNNGFTGTWSPAVINTATVGTTTYTFTPTDPCAAVTTMDIVIIAQVTPMFTAVASICSGGTLTALPTTSNNGITGTGAPALNNTATTAYTFTPTAGQCATTTTLTITVNPRPTAPTVGTITQPTCPVPTGSVVLNGLPSSGTWTINPGGITGSGTTTTITGLSPGTYNFTVTNSFGCISPASANVVVNPVPTVPPTPTPANNGPL